MVLSSDSEDKISWNTITLGATPKVIKSARLSSCLPSSPLTFNSLAKKPSKKSRKAPLKIHSDAEYKSFE